jgi:hypothetical protein
MHKTSEKLFNRCIALQPNGYMTEHLDLFRPSLAPDLHIEPSFPYSMSTQNQLQLSRCGDVRRPH